MVTACAHGHDGLRLISLRHGWGRAAPPVVWGWGAEGAPASTGVRGFRGRDTLTQSGGCLWPAAPGGSERGVGGPRPPRPGRSAWLTGQAGPGAPHAGPRQAPVLSSRRAELPPPGRRGRGALLLQPGGVPEAGARLSALQGTVRAASPVRGRVMVALGARASTGALPSAARPSGRAADRRVAYWRRGRRDLPECSDYVRGSSEWQETF